MQWFFLGLVVLGFCVIGLRLHRDRVRLAPIRDAVKKETVVYRTPISVQWGRGLWGRGNAKGMNLVVRESSFELSYPFPGGSLLTTEWYCFGKDAQMKMGVGLFLPPAIKRDCIALSVPSVDNPHVRQELLLSYSTPNSLRTAWDALAACGTQAVGEPPIRGD